MDEQYRKLFKNLAKMVPPAGLTSAILARIEAARRAHFRRRFVFYVSAACLSCAALVPAVRFAMSEFYRTGFYDYVSLAFSDSGAVLSVWKDFALSLADSLPVFALAVLLSTIFAFAGSLFMAVKNMAPKSEFVSA